MGPGGVVGRFGMARIFVLLFVTALSPLCSLVLGRRRVHRCPVGWVPRGSARGCWPPVVIIISTYLLIVPMAIGTTVLSAVTYSSEVGIVIAVFRVLRVVI